MRVYIAGPINGYPDGNREAFQWAAAELRGMGYDPVDPHDIGVLEHSGLCLGDPVPHSRHHYGCYMVPDIHALLDCEGYTLLAGWEASKGAKVEQQVAEVCGKRYIETTWR